MWTRAAVCPLVACVSFQYVVGADEIIEQLVIQCWLFQARGGERAAARRQAELALERLLAEGIAVREWSPGPASGSLRCRQHDQGACR